MRSPMKVKQFAANVRELKRRDRLEPNADVVRERSRKRKFHVPEVVAYRMALRRELMKRAVLHREGRHEAIAIRDELFPLSEL